MTEGGFLWKRFNYPMPLFTASNDSPFAPRLSKGRLVLHYHRSWLDKFATNGLLILTSSSWAR
jgi:hypothetical protein